MEEVQCKRVDGEAMNSTMPYPYPYNSKQIQDWLAMGTRIHLMWNPEFPDHALGFEVGRDPNGKEYVYAFILDHSDDEGWRFRSHWVNKCNWFHPISGWIARKTVEASVSRETAVGMWEEAREAGWREWRKPSEVSEEKEG